MPNREGETRTKDLSHYRAYMVSLYSSQPSDLLFFLRGAWSGKQKQCLCKILGDKQKSSMLFSEDAYSEAAMQRLIEKGRPERRISPIIGHIWCRYTVRNPAISCSFFVEPNQEQQ